VPLVGLSCVGLLRNVPRLSGVIDFGDRVLFGAEHVCAYAYTSEELGHDAAARCLLLQRVAEAELPPPLLLLTEQGDWEAHAKDESGWNGSRYVRIEG
jgi:hypothetical protein